MFGLLQAVESQLDDTHFRKILYCARCYNSCGVNDLQKKYQYAQAFPHLPSQNKKTRSKNI